MYKTGWHVVEMARKRERPILRDYLPYLFSDFVELHGDRCYGCGKLIIGGFATLRESKRKVMIIGQHKEKDPKLMRIYNFGQTTSEDFRKAIRLTKLAGKVGLPILTFIDTLGASPDSRSEEKGISYSIALSLYEMSKVRTPVISTVIGEGGSGGALGIGIADKVLMQENAYYSVISPEGCSSILWKNGHMKKKAAQHLHLRAKDLYRLKIIDDIISEPEGGAHTNVSQAATFVHKTIMKNLEDLLEQDTHELMQNRTTKWRSIGNYFIEQVPKLNINNNKNLTIK